ncbi:MAG: cyanophycinase [Phycisphaerales bacterium]|nr:cyanophycinase [Phycisphaerales bacterium]MCB9862365.1 cyanophycinase [Phycisphaerales bacterium]
MIVGGGGTPEGVVARAIEMAGGADCRVVVVPQASMRAEAGNESAEMFREAGARNVRVLRIEINKSAGDVVNAGGMVDAGSASNVQRSADAGNVANATNAANTGGAAYAKGAANMGDAAKSRDAANKGHASKAGGAVEAGGASRFRGDSEIEILNDADLIWFSGGDQNRLMRRLNEAGIADVIRQRFRDGCVVGGTSAGAAVMSERMITGKADLESIAHGGTELAGGLGLWPGVIVDQHFLKRRRFNRLYSAVLDHPDLIGVGIDERTAVIVRGDRIDVMGDSSVMIIDARNASTSAGERGRTATQVRVDTIAPGDSSRF